jgi:NAD(P)-dependent dehydrogenase (short-subunit alcohol dehydrogenase family)
MQHFGPNSTADEVLAGLDLWGRRVIITGVSSAGLGVETARALVARGATVIGAARDLAKAERAVAEVRHAEQAGGGSLELVALDLADLASVHAAADALVTRGEPLDLVIANAGIMATPFARTLDGFEAQLATNLLGHYVLANRLAPLMRVGARLVVLSSNSHRFADFDLSDPNYERTPYEPWAAYARSKTGDALLAVAFDARYRARGVRAVSVHPGLIKTDLTKDQDLEVMEKMLNQMQAEDAKHGLPPFEYKSMAQGAATGLWAGLVADADKVGGRYCEDCAVAELLPEDAYVSPLRGGVRAYAIDPRHAESVWSKLGEIVGDCY